MKRFLKIYLLLLLCAGATVAWADSYIDFNKDFIEKTDINFLVDRAAVLEPERKKIQVKIGHLEQAKLLPNPTFELKFKNIPGDFQLGERTDEFYLHQKFELGGKRYYRVKVGEKEVEESKEDFSYKRALLKNEVTKLFNTIVYLQRRLEKEKEILYLTDKMRKLAEVKLAFGKISRKDFIEYEADYTRKTLKIETLAGQIKENLRLFEEKVGLRPGTIKVVRGELLDMENLIRVSNFALEDVEKNPEIQLLKKRIEVARQKLERERYKFIPDLTLKAMMSSERGRNNDTYGFEIMLPLPLFDRNQGEIMAASAALEKAEMELHARHLGILGSLAECMTSYENTIRNLEKYNKEILPLVEEKRRFFNIAYERGRISMLENIKAEVHLLETEIEKMELQVRAQNLLQELLFLTGGVH